jgi:hypothetical protein
MAKGEEEVDDGGVPGGGAIEDDGSEPLGAAVRDPAAAGAP